MVNLGKYQIIGKKMQVRSAKNHKCIRLRDFSPLSEGSGGGWRCATKKVGGLRKSAYLCPHYRGARNGARVLKARV